MPVKKRKTALIETLKQQDVRYTLLFDPANIFYYTGFLSEPHERFMALFMDHKTGAEHLFVPALDETAAQQAAETESIIAISDEQNPYEILQKTLPQLEGKIGIEGDYLPYNRFRQIGTAFSDVTFQPIEPLIHEQRMIKSASEIEALQVAIRLIEQVLEEGVKRIKPGMTEQEITAELEYLMRMVGADGPSFATIVLAGENAALPHGVPGMRKIQQGDVLLIDFGVIKDGYCSDITRTFAIGDVTDEVRTLYDIVLASNMAGIEAVQAGVPLSVIDLAARDVIIEAGYGAYFNNRIGHGLGIEVHEVPSVHETNAMKTKAGMVFTIEPGIYLPGRLGIRIEDIVHVNEAGHVDVLTAFPKSLQIIGE